jgi:hypothetical protein
MVEVLTVVGTATKDVKRGRMSELISRCVFLPLSTKFYLEKYLKKLIGDSDIEDSLQRLDKLTQEEAKMASAELLRITHSVEEKVTGVDNRVQSVDDKIQGIDDKVQGIDSEVKCARDRVQGIDGKLDDINRSSSHLSPDFTPGGSDLFTGNLLRDNFLRWLSPSDPSTNHNIATKAHHDGTAQWFFQGSIFNNWKSAGSFLWIHGKREFPLDFTRSIGPDHLGSIAGSGKSVLRLALPQRVPPYRTHMMNTARRSFKIS